MDIETRLTNLENLVNSLIKTINSNKFYTDADISGCRHTEGDLANVNTDQDADISDNSAAVFDLAEMEDDNSTAIFDLADISADLDARVTALEEKEG